MSAMRRVRAGRPGTAGGLAMLALLGVVAGARPADAGLPEDFQALVTAREALLQALQDRQAADRKAGPAQNFHLYLDEGADRDELNLVLRRAGGRWRAAYGEVPAWEQGTMQEWRGYNLSNRTGCAWRPVLRFAADPAGLALDGDRLAGPLAVAFRLDQTLDEKLPPGKPWSWWDKFIPTGYTLPRRQTYTFDAAVRPDAHFFDLVLENGVNWQPKPTGGKVKGKGKVPAEGKAAEGKPADEAPAPAAEAVRRPIFIQLLVPSTRFTVACVRTPTWNGGYHEGDATGLQFNDGRLTGALVVFLHQDGWTPWGGGKTWQHPPQVLRFKVEAALRHHVLSGTYAATGDMGEFTGAVRGKGGRAVTGRYAATGQIGDQAGGLWGMMLDDPAPLREQVPAESAVPAAAAAAARHIAGRINTVLHHVRALNLALQHYPLPLAEALAQTDTAAPAWDAEKADAAALAAYVAEARRLLAGVPAPDKPDLPAAETEGTGDSPSLGVRAAPVNDDAVNVLPGEASGEWYYLGRWQVVGPFEGRVGLENDTGLVPEVVPAACPGLVQPTDRFGAVRADAPTVQWQAAAYEGPRLAAPWEKAGFYTRFAGQVWYAAAQVQSDKARPVWFSLEAGDHGKLWVNGRLVWADAEKPWRYRARGRVVVPAGLEAGVNRLLVRVARDRRSSWVRLALTARRPSAGEPRPPRQAVFAGPYVFPDSKPPLAWDIDAGINVAWRKPELGGSARPVLAGDAILAISPPHTLFCADAATGALRWSREANVLELLDPGAAAKWRAADEAGRLALLKARERDLGLERRFNNLGDIRAAEPVSDGRHVWVHAGTGAAACYDLSGDRRWIVRTNLAAAQVHLAKGLLVIEGQATSTWPLPPDFPAAPQAKGRAPAVGILVLDASTGREGRRWTLPGAFEGGASRLLTAGSGAAETAVLLTSTGWIVDPAGGGPPVPMNVEYPGPSDEDYQRGGQVIGGRSGRPFSITHNGDTLFMMAQEQGLAVRLWPAGPGRLGYAHLWQSHYEHGGFGSFAAPAVATDRHLFVWNPVLERGPHCPDARVELHVHDARTGRPLARLKPGLENAVSHSVMPVVAGRYVFCFDAGGGTHGGLQGHGQVLVATADDRPQVVARNLMDIGTRASPVFAGERMYLRSPAALTCVAVTTAEGRRWQDERLAETLLGELGAAPVTASPRRIAPAAALALGPGVPVGKLLDGRATEFWLGAGPFPEGGDEALLAALRPQAGDAVRIGGQARPFEALSRQAAFNEPPLFRRQYVLQGTGDIVPFFSTLVDPRAVSGPAGTGLLYTVLDNTRDRIVIPTLKAKGLTMWLSGERLRADEPLHLGPGLYPFLVRIDPSYYVIDEKEILPPVDVEKALQAGALKDIGWPKTWQVIGPLPPDAAPLAPGRLRAIPDRVTVGDREYPAYAIPEDQHTVYLTSLADLREGEKPDVAKAPKEREIGSPSHAYVFAPIECPADGFLYVTGSADWFMRWYVDGEVAYDTMKGGNAAATTALDAHPWAVRVTKGRHVLAVLVKPGARGWSFTSLGGFSEKMSEALAAFGVPSKQKREEPDIRLAPAFAEVPHPPTRQRRWQDELQGRRARLEAVVRDLAGTDAARAAAGLLADIKP
jgi:hypothetical protein